MPEATQYARGPRGNSLVGGPGDLTGRIHLANTAGEKDNEKARVAAKAAINDNQSLRYVSVPGSSTPWPIPLALWEALPDSLR